MVIGILSIDVWADGVMPVFLKNFMNISMMPVKSLRSSLIQRLFGLIHLQRVPRKKNDGQTGEALGRSHGGFTTKLHAAVSDAFLPLRFILTAGARHDVTQAPALIAGYTCESVIADAAYDSDAFRQRSLIKEVFRLFVPGRTVLKLVLMMKTCINSAMLLNVFSSVEAVSSSGYTL